MPLAILELALVAITICPDVDAPGVYLAVLVLALGDELLVLVADMFFAEVPKMSEPRPIPRRCRSSSCSSASRLCTMP